MTENPTPADVKRIVREIADRQQHAETIRTAYDWRPRYCRCRGPKGQRRQLADVALCSGSTMVYLICPTCGIWTPREPPANAGHELRCARVVTGSHTLRLGGHGDGCGALLGYANIPEGEAVLIRCGWCTVWNVFEHSGITVRKVL
jgi:hypothetical protein